MGVRAVGIGWLSEVLGVLEGGEKLPFLGIKGIDVSFDMSYQGIPEGVYITDVVAGSPAYEAGLKRGDIITALGGGQIGSVEDYSSFLLRQKPGSDLKVRIQRSSGIEEYREISLYLKTGER
jgi:S1-C subfamily serine protease